VILHCMIIYDRSYEHLVLTHDSNGYWIDARNEHWLLTPYNYYWLGRYKTRKDWGPNKRPPGAVKVIFSKEEIPDSLGHNEVGCLEIQRAKARRDYHKGWLPNSHDGEREDLATLITRMVVRNANAC